jgi:AAA domain-containing protein/DnaB helicase-like protein
MHEQSAHSDGHAQPGLNGRAPLIGDRLVMASGSDEQSPFQRAPHNLEAEQALLGAILLNNEAMKRVSSFLEVHHFFDPLHQQIFETAAKLINGGKQVTPVTLRTFFETAEPFRSDLSVPQYLGTLAANATTIINVADYARTIVDLATRRAIIIACEDARDAAYDSGVDATVAEQIEQLHGRLNKLRSECSREPLSVSRCLADVEAQPIRWFWPSRIALSKLTLLAGAPGLGKSQLTCAFVAAATTGGKLADGENAPWGSAIIITTEDDAADTIRPRLEAAGADLSRVHLFDWALGLSRYGKREHQHFDVNVHSGALADLVHSIGDVRLIVIDPITAHSGRTDTHATAEVRRSLVPLQTMAAETGAAVVLITHLNKGGSGDGSAMSRVTGSNAYVAVCRSAWLVAPDPKDTERRRRMLVPIKNNIGDDKTGFAFTIEGVTLPAGIATSRVAFEPFRVFVTADELLQIKPNAEAVRSAVEEACDFLRKELAGGPKRATDIQSAAKDAGITHDTLKRARKALGVKARKEGKAGWRLELPSVKEAEKVEEADQFARGVNQALGKGVEL